MASIDDFGEIPGIKPGHIFKKKDDCYKSGVHKSPRGGVHGSEALGAASICISGGYEDNKDEGNIIWYTGSGGQDDEGCQTQVGDQTFTSTTSNRALYTSYQQRRAVRVIRGAGKANSLTNNLYAPKSGYRYDGLYYVDDARIVEGKSKHKVCQFRLVRSMTEGMKGIPTRRVLTTERLKKMMRSTTR
ncbi:SRA-YDG [Coniophora puteana RWD-64-598 SS2]|uniref:SRA-YDG n=1 Tax=Coniophora puteana (strain RWD-64-598) TaxID=741705 RepID=A0A5M3MYL4_CONPW|nr:SRA-YDG [Coniophora puteana RWD-64-598 SS2]EIW84117.1 SRA-YDG [Coniophora puteana RWD-64-598 SS2]